MKFDRTGRFRDAGTDTLTKADLTTSDPDGYRHWADGKLRITTAGEDRGNNYRYELTLEATELIHFIKIAAANVAETKAESAILSGAIATLEQLIAPPTPKE